MDMVADMAAGTVAGAAGIADQQASFHWLNSREEREADEGKENLFPRQIWPRTDTDFRR